MPVRTQSGHIRSRCVLRITAGVVLGLALVSCGAGTTSAIPELSITSMHTVVDGVVRWDPNVEPVLALSVGRSVATERGDAVVWFHDGWQVDDSEWRGADLRVDVDTPGCGYGGYEFRITAMIPGESEASVRVWMEPYICAGSPWLTE